MVGCRVVVGAEMERGELFVPKAEVRASSERAQERGTCALPLRHCCLRPPECCCNFTPPNGSGSGADAYNKFTRTGITKKTD